LNAIIHVLTVWGELIGKQGIVNGHDHPVECSDGWIVTPEQPCEKAANMAQKVSPPPILRKISLIPGRDEHSLFHSMIDV
jgi:hypothetical protein